MYRKLKQKTKIIHKDSANNNSLENKNKQNMHPKEQQSLEGIYEDHNVVQLAGRCKEGYPSAMRLMADFFRSLCTSPLLELLDRYESDPTGDNEMAIKVYLKKKYHESKNAKAYMMWLVRAALYGDGEVSAQLEKWPFYKEFAFIPYDMMMGKRNSLIMFSNSSTLREMGFIDVPAGYEDCRLRYSVEKKYFDLCYVSFYDPPDEYGFGAEWEYSDIYFDEFFCRLPAKPKQSND